MCLISLIINLLLLNFYCLPSRYNIVGPSVHIIQYIQYCTWSSLFHCRNVTYVQSKAKLQQQHADACCSMYRACPM